MIRAQAGAAAREKVGVAAERGIGSSAHAQPSRDAEPVPGTTDGAEIQRKVALRVRALSPDDPHRQRKAYRIFLESVLVQALGRERLGGPGLDQMVDVVLERMESDAQLLAALRQAADQLLADAKLIEEDSEGRPSGEAPP